jgi:hypothetical protein
MMKVIMMFIVVVMLSACGLNGNQRFTANDSTHRVVQEGEGFIYVIIRLEFIDQIRELCEDLNPIEDYESEANQKKAVAECALNGFTLFNLNLDLIGEFLDDKCDDLNTEGMTPEEIEQAEELCKLFGGFQ